MAEYIDREAVLEAAKKSHLYFDIKPIINSIPAADVRPVEWIPVTERLPKMIDGENISKDVYVTDGTEIAKACIMRDYDGVAGWTYTGIGKITHWCERIPLPQPPEEEI